MPKVPHGKEKGVVKPPGAKDKSMVRIYNPKNFIGSGATSENSGVTPNEHTGMGFNYGMCHKNKMGRMRGDSVGYIPVSKEELGTPPTSVV